MLEPSRIVIYRSGEREILVPGSPGFDPPSQASAQAFANVDSPGLIEIGLSAATLERYRVQFTVIEFFYEEPLQFHVPFDARNPTQLLFPIYGAHAGNGWFFRGKNGEYWFGAMRVATPELILDAVAGVLAP